MKLWGGRFTSGLNDTALKYSSSIEFDSLLFDEDIAGSIAHASMLKKIGILKESEYKQIVDGLDTISYEYSEGKWKPGKNEFEDIHSAIESKLTSCIGDTAGKLHTGRSRNDQVITDVRLWAKKHSLLIMQAIRQTQSVLVALAADTTEVIMPGYTHMQQAQPVSFAFHLLAYVEMLERDYKRFAFVFGESDQSPLGSGALAGSTIPLDRYHTAETLGFASIAKNALDAVSDRDFIIDFVHSCSVGMLHLSRFAEEIIIWSSQEWNFIKLGDAVSTGSSLMPQKKNPDLAELLRGKTARVLGQDMALKTLIKGLPLSYNRDLQEDKEPLFNSAQTYYDSLCVVQLILQNCSLQPDRFSKELEGSFIFSTDLADWLVLQDVPFRKAHHIVGEIVRYCEKNNKKMNQLTLTELHTFDPHFNESVFAIFNLAASLKRKITVGSPNPDLVKKEIAGWNKIIGDAPATKS
ncbi:MAG: argininosuccinate lyase [Bacteroidota bacterium]|nr:argininosuccinate lyase [Bacteroidota bacterium]